MKLFKQECKSNVRCQKLRIPDQVKKWKNCNGKCLLEPVQPKTEEVVNLIKLQESGVKAKFDETNVFQK